jgi:hypothetical protein
MKLSEFLNEDLNLDKILSFLTEKGYAPGIYRRGNVWRAHLDVCVNNWEEDYNTINAFRKCMNKESNRTKW